MRQFREFMTGAAIALLGHLVLITLALLIIANTDWGREQVRTHGVSALNESIAGEAQIDRIEGNLFGRFDLIGVSIIDEDGVPLVVADTISTRISAFSIVRQRIILTGTRLVDAHVLLDQPPGKEWNFVRIFVDPESEAAPTRWGHWLEIRNPELVRSSLTIRTAWTPPDDATPAEREEAIRRARAGETRTNVVEVEGGYQNVMTFTELDAAFSRVVIAHPRVEGIPIEVDRFAGIVQPFRPPAAEVHDLVGNFLLRNDSLFFDNITAQLPDSRVSGEGVYVLDKGELVLRLEGAPVALADLRWLYPPLPTEGGGNLHFLLDQRGSDTRLKAYDMDLVVRDGRVRGRFDMTLGDTIRFQDTDVAFAQLDSRVIDDLIPGWQAPRQGLLTGEVMIDGIGRALQVDADVTFDDFAAPASRVLAEGQIAFVPELGFSDLLVRAAPLRAELIRAFVPDLPVAGEVEGFARMTGSPSGLLDLDSDLTIRDPASGVSRVLATGGLDLRDDILLRDLYVRVDPLRVDLLRPLVPQLPAGATATGEARLNGDPYGLLRLDGQVALSDPRTGLSRIAAAGAIDTRGELRLHDILVTADPLQVDLLRGEVPELPAGATLTGRARLDGVPARELTLDADLALNDPATGVSHVAAVGGVRFEPNLHFLDLRLDLDPLQLDLVRAEMPELPPGATVTGPLRLDGPPDGLLHVDGDLTLNDPATGVSRVAAHGGISITEPRFTDLDLRFDPLQLPLVQRFDPDFPLGGTLEGTATLNGRPDTAIGFSANVTHREAGEVSRVAGRGHVVTADPGGRVELDLNLDPLSLRTVGRFVPEAGLRGEVAGTVQARGTLGDFSLNASLTVPDTGLVVLNGRFDLASPEPGYDFTARLIDFDLDAVTAHAPAETNLTGTLQAEGRGIDPETMTASIEADLVGPSIDGLEADEVHLRATLAEGLATFNPAVIRLATAEARLEGSFGLVPGRSGVLHYSVKVDSLRALAAWMPALDTAVVLTDPEVRAALARAVAEAERAALVEALATRQPPRPVEVDTLSIVEQSRAVLAGRLEAEGTLRGNVERFDAEGTAEVEHLVFDGNFIETGRARYALANIGTEYIEGDVVASTGAIRIEGFAFDSTAVDVSYRGLRFGEGRASIVAIQDDYTDFGADLEFTLALDRNHILLTGTRFRFDEVTWTDQQPTTISWGEAGIEVDSFELISTDGARLFIDGRLPIDGDPSMEIEIERLDVEHILTLLQEDIDLTGLVSLRATIEGTADNPVIVGDAAMTDIVYEGRPLPRAEATFNFADQLLTARAEAIENGQTVAVAVAEVPADLSLTGEEGPRLLDGPLRIDIDADAIPLDVVHLFTDEVEIEDGIAAGRIQIRGTTTNPEVGGDLTFAASRVYVDAAGMEFERVRGSVSLQESGIVIDTLVAWSDGPIRLSGTIALDDFADPVFNITGMARQAWVIDTDDANLRVDADLEISGSFPNLEITGDVVVHQGVIYIPELLAADSIDPIDLDDPETFARVDADLTARAAAAVEPPSFLEYLTANISVVVERDVWLRSSEANIEVYTPTEVGPITVRMDPRVRGFILEGTVNSDRGQYEFMSRRLEVTRGAATFTGDVGFNPFIQLVAQHEVRPPGSQPIQIRLVLSGPVDDLDLELESDAEPPIPQTDLMAYFVFGHEASSLLGHSGSTLAGEGAGGRGFLGDITAVAMQQLTGVFLDAVIGGFEMETARALGLDVFRVTTVNIPQEILTGGFEDILRGTEFEGGLYLTPRIFVAAQVRPTLVHPGLLFDYRTPGGFQWNISLRSQYLTPEPTLEEQELERVSVFGSFVRRIWRF